MNKSRRLIASMLSAIVILTTGAASIGCAAAAQWWQGVLSNPGSVSSFIQYVLTFLQGAVALWNAIFPLIPTASQAKAQLDFNNSVYTVEQALAAAEDAVRAAAAAHQANPDFSAVITNVQAAVAALMKIVQAWQGTQPAVATTTDISRQAGVIANWK